MKTKIWLYLIAVISFTFLFYRQDAGINLTLFAGLLLTAATILNKTNRRSCQWLIIAAGTLISAFFVGWYSNSLSVIMAIISLIMLSILKNSKRTSYFLAFFIGIASMVGSVIFMILAKIDANRLKQFQKTKPSNSGYKWWPVTIVAMVAFVFMTIYREINPVFNNYFIKIFSDIDLGWLVFSIFGAILLYTFFYPPRLVKKLLPYERNYGKTIVHDASASKTQSVFSLFASFDHERYSALLLFIILNILLLILNIFDIQYLFLKGELPEGITYSDYVHRGVGAVILSILLAIGVISYYFRGLINFDSGSKIIKLLTYVWILQNIVLVIMTAFKNQLYIEAFSLTYMRIGVYYYLGFALIGLLLTIYKIYFTQDIWFLFRTNSLAIYVVLILSCFFNWNMIVTRYNIQNSKEIDYVYLSELGHANYPVLWEHHFFESQEHKKYELRLTQKTESYLLPSKIGEFLQEYESLGIQSRSWNKKQTYNYFAELAKDKKLSLNQ